MRRYLTMCAVALVACSDTSTIAPPRTNLMPRDEVPVPKQSPGKFDARTAKDYVEALVAERFGKVTLPPDAFSKSADAVHPDIACMPGGWNGADCWLMYTPYQNSDPSWENPGLLLEANDTSWQTPTAIQNPIIPWPGAGSYNSDPDQAFDPGTQRLIQMYRVVADTTNRIMIMSTADARQWTTPVLAFAVRSHMAVSPSLVIERDRSAKVWYINSGTVGCTAPATTVEVRTAQPGAGENFESVRWSDPTTTKLSIPGYVPWHIDVEEMPAGGYIALIAAFPQGSICSQSDLWLATSDDGLDWRTLPLPIMWRGMKIATKRYISTWYRGTLRYNPKTDLLDIWPSALAGQAWTIYHTTVPLARITELMASASPSDLKSIKASSALVPKPTIAMP